jgi:hypothetical protein
VLWSARFDEPLGRVHLTGQYYSAIVMPWRFGHANRAASQVGKPTESLEAHDYVLRAAGIAASHAGNVAEARTLLKRAIELIRTMQPRMRRLGKSY